MLVHAFVDHSSVTLGSTFEHFVGGSDLTVSLCNNRDVHQNKTILIGAPVELTYSLDMVLQLLALWRKHFLVLVGEHIGVWIIHKFPVVESISVGILEEGLSVADPVTDFLHWHSQLFWKMIATNAIIFGGDVVEMARFVKVGRGEEGEITEERGVDSVVFNVKLLDFIDEVRQVREDRLAKKIFSQKAFGAVRLMILHFIEKLVDNVELGWEVSHGLLSGKETMLTHVTEDTIEIVALSGELSYRGL